MIKTNAFIDFIDFQVISASEDGTAIVYSLTDGAYIRTIGQSSIYKAPNLATHRYRANPSSGTTTATATTDNDTTDDDDDDDRTEQSRRNHNSEPSGIVRLAIVEDDGPGRVTWVGVTSSGGYIVLYFSEDMLLRVYSIVSGPMCWSWVFDPVCLILCV